MFILIPAFLICIIIILLFCKHILGDGKEIYYSKPIHFKDMNVNMKKDSKYTAIIIEPREHKALEFVLNNFLENLNDDWNIIVFHGNKNTDYLNNIINTKLGKYANRISLVNLNIDDLSIRDYSYIFYDPSFYELIPTETFLVFQTDTIICTKYKDLINEFIKYDYVGAPWTTISDDNKNRVGNGGLSLRKKSKSLEILKKCKVLAQCDKDITCDYEDLIMSQTRIDKCFDMNLFKPSNEESQNFSIEAILNDKAFGIHKAWNYVDINLLKGWCPDVITLRDLNKSK